MIKIIRNTIFAYAALLFVTGCSNYPVLSELANNRMTLILKGTYESNTPYAMAAPINSPDITTSYNGVAGIDSALTANDIGFFIDIANIRISRNTNSNTTSQDYWKLFAENRVVLCDANSDIIGHQLFSCANNNGVSRLNQFFDEGFEYPAVDIPPGTYRHVGIYFRKFITYPAILYNQSPYSQKEVMTAIFDNRSVYGYDLNERLLQYAQGDSSESNSLMIPLSNNGLNIYVDDSMEAYVLEVRLFVKNLLMKHVMMHGLDSSAEYPLTFVGPSDWRYDYAYTNQTEGFHLGNHLLLTARVYTPGNVGSISVSDTDGAPALAYFIAVPAGSAVSSTSLPYAATSIDGTGNGSITNLPPGSYDVYETCDNSAPLDNYPETAVLLSASVAVTKDTATVVSGAFACP